MAIREARASWQRLLFFFLCIALGVAAIVALRSVIQSVRHVISGEARSLIAADVLISTNRGWTPELRQMIDRELAGGQVLARTESIETATMVRPEDETKTVAKMVELRAVQDAFPLYGTLGLQGARTFSHAMLTGHGALVRPELLSQLDVEVGDRIIIGTEPFEIRGVITTEPGRRLGAFSFGPRVLIDYQDLQGTGLLAFGSRAQYQLLLRVNDSSIEPLVTRLREAFRDQFVVVRSYRSTEDSIGEDLSRAENYLSLVGLVIVVLGGIAVSSVTKVFVTQKIPSIAVLKCLGATTRQVLAVYLVQVLLLGMAGSLLGVGLAAAAIAAVPRFAGTTVGSLNVAYNVTSTAALQGLCIGLLVSALFALVPLLDVRHVKPSRLLRHEMTARASRDWLKIAIVLFVGTALVLVASWQASSLRVGLAVSTGFAVVAAVLQAAGWLLVRAIRPLAQSQWFPLRQGVLRISRPGNQTRVILLSVGLGSFFILGIRAVQINLLHEFAFDVRENAPDMFLIDIQPDQSAPVLDFLKQPNRVAGDVNLIPVLRARVAGVKGRDVNLETVEDVRGRGSLGREYVITYRNRLEQNERVSDGRFWTDPAPPASPEVSIEQSIHERFSINVGDTMRFDVLGRVITARVSSIREVEWRDSRAGGFMFVFSPGVFDRAPHMFIAPLRAPVVPEIRARMQHDLVAAFPNVSVIDVREVAETLRRILGNITLAISVVGALVLASGCLILVGAVAMTRFQRVYEAAIFRTLGASTRLLSRLLVFEYGILGLLSGTIGSLGAIALSWGVSRYALDIDWQPAIALTVAGVILTAFLVTAIGVMSSLDVLRRKPLSTLRAE
jgi:putative ABC transport system permease protein